MLDVATVSDWLGTRKREALYANAWCHLFCLLVILLVSCRQNPTPALTPPAEAAELAALPLDTAEFSQQELAAHQKLADSKALPAPDYDTLAWTEVIRLDATMALDLRYATDSNFVGETMYDCGRCFLRPAAALSLKRVHDSLRTLGLGLRLFDCYRPLPVQWRLWNKVPDRRYVADPRKGSQHNRGVAVDLTIDSLATGRPLDMGTAYDFFGGKAWHRATVGFAEPIRGNRTRLLELMEGFGWRRTNSEWWHYSFPMSRSVAKLDSMEWACNLATLD